MWRKQMEYTSWWFQVEMVHNSGKEQTGEPKAFFSSILKKVGEQHSGYEQRDSDEKEK